MPMKSVKRGRPKGSKNKIKVNDVNPFDLLLRSLTEQYPDDPTIPGVSLAYIPRLKQFYGSIVRFRSTFAKDRYVILKAFGDDSVEVLSDLLTQWREHITLPTTVATDQLREME